MRAGFIAFPASDFEESRRFYAEVLALPLVGEGEDGFSRNARFDLGGLGVTVYEWTGPFRRAHTGLQVYVDDLEAVYGRLSEAGVKFIGGIREEPWGGRVVTVSDPDGNLFDLLDSSYEAIWRAPAATAGSAEQPGGEEGAAGEAAGAEPAGADAAGAGADESDPAAEAGPPAEAGGAAEPVAQEEEPAPASEGSKGEAAGEGPGPAGEEDGPAASEPAGAEPEPAGGAEAKKAD